MSVLDHLGIDHATQRLLEGSHNVGTWATTDIQGLAELERNLNELPEKVARKVLFRACRDAAELFRARAAMAAPVDTTQKEKDGMHLKDGILKAVSARYQGVKGASIRAKVALHKDVFYGRFIEFGWTPAGSTGSTVPARPFMRPAWEAMKGTALALFEVRLREGIQAAAKELHRQ